MKINPKKNYLLGYVGGKFQIANWIIKHFKFHKRYVEVFGGGAHVLLQKQRLNINGYEEIYNDTNDDLLNFYKVVLKNPEKFFERCEYLPYSRKFYKEWNEDWKNGRKGKDDFERAVRYFLLQKFCFSGIFLGSFGGGGKRINAFRSASNRIPNFVKRFQRVLIENFDYEDLIEKYDGPGTLFYCDPPYICDGEFYGVKDFDHERLARVLKKAKGMIVLSYYPCKELKKLYGDWWINSKRVNKMAHLTRAENGEKKAEVSEILLLNYKIKGLKKFKDTNLCKYKV